MYGTDPVKIVDVDFDYLPNDIANSMINFCKIKNISYDVCAYIKSKVSCRFISLEDDGVIRVCFKTDDDHIDFSGVEYQVCDVSDWLITTDMFDC